MHGRAALIAVGKAVQLDDMGQTQPNICKLKNFPRTIQFRMGRGEPQIVSLILLSFLLSPVYFF